jgi:hypothetical protein
MASAAQLFLRAGKPQKCAYCARKLHVKTARNDQRATRDHVHPRHLGGTKCVWACIACNQLKGGMTLEAWQAFMQKNPRWWVGFRPTGRRRKRLGPKKRSPSANATPVRRKAATLKQTPEPTHAEALPCQGTTAAPAKRGRPKFWFRRGARRPAPQPTLVEAKPALIEAKPAPKPAKRARIWIRRKARASMAAQERSEA